MVQFTRISRLWLIVVLFIFSGLAEPAHNPFCPTITRTTTSKSCPRPTPTFCAQPQCILMSKIDVPCGCPATIPSETDYQPCTSGCHGACGTAYETNFLPCSTSSPTPESTPPLTTITEKPSPSCVTITKTDGPNCSQTACASADCIIESTVTNPCGCTGIAETTSCKTKCDGACSTQWKSVYLPCPFSPPPSADPTPTGGYH